MVQKPERSPPRITESSGDGDVAGRGARRGEDCLAQRVSPHSLKLPGQAPVKAPATLLSAEEVLMLSRQLNEERRSSWRSSGPDAHQQGDLQTTRLVDTISRAVEADSTLNPRYRGLGSLRHALPRATTTTTTTRSRATSRPPAQAVVDQVVTRRVHAPATPRQPQPTGERRLTRPTAAAGGPPARAASMTPTALRGSSKGGCVAVDSKAPAKARPTARTHWASAPSDTSHGMTGWQNCGGSDTTAKTRVPTSMATIGRSVRKVMQRFTQKKRDINFAAIVPFDP